MWQDCSTKKKLKSYENILNIEIFYIMIYNSFKDSDIYEKETCRTA